MRKTTGAFTLLALYVGINAHAQAPIDASIVIDGANYALAITTLGTDDYAVEDSNTAGAIHIVGANGDTADIFAHAFHSSANVWEIDYTLNWVNPNGPGNVTFGIYAPVHAALSVPGGPTLTNASVAASITTLNTNNYITPLAVTAFPDNSSIALPPDAGATTLQRVFLGNGTTVDDTGQDLGGPESFPTATTYNYGIRGPGPGLPDPIGSPHYDYLLLTSSFSTGGNGIDVMLNGSASETYVPEPGTVAMLGAGLFSSLLLALRRQSRR